MKPLLVANWKMNMPRSEALVTAKKIAEARKTFPDIDVVICPTLTELAEISEIQGVLVGAQNFYPLEKGSVTGEVPVSSIQDLAQYAILGHSERRILLHEDNRLIAEKVEAALSHNITPIVCVGETLQERKKGAIARVLHEQLRQIVEKAAHFREKDLVITYEPVWAIHNHAGSRPATAHDVKAAVTIIHALLHDMNRDTTHVRILYGGSVDETNASSFFSIQDVAGALVGTSSLTSKSFVALATLLQKEKYVR